MPTNSYTKKSCLVPERNGQKSMSCLEEYSRAFIPGKMHVHVIITLQAHFKFDTAGDVTYKRRGESERI